MNHPLKETPPAIILITGNMASGKSSVAQAVAERLPKSVHLRGDLFRRLIVNGQAEMSFELSTEAEQQLKLRYGLAVETAKRYADAGFTVIYQDIIIGKTLAEMVTALADYPHLVIVLCPRPDVIAQREADRAKTGYADPAHIQAFDHVLRQETPPIGHWIDTSEMTIAESAQLILARAGLESA